MLEEALMLDEVEWRKSEVRIKFGELYFRFLVHIYFLVCWFFFFFLV